MGRVRIWASCLDTQTVVIDIIYLEHIAMHRMSTLMEKIDGWISKTANDFFGSDEADEIIDKATMPIWKKNAYVDQPTDKLRAEDAINAIYKRAGLEPPMIIWTQSPLANVFAKVSIDYLSNADLSIPWGFKHRDQFVENNDIRGSAWQSVCEAGWSVGDIGTGSEAWDNVRLYEIRKDICWNHIAPSQVYGASNGLIGYNLDNAWYSVGDIVAARSNNDWLVDMLMRYSFAKEYPNPNMYSGGSRSMHLRFIRNKGGFRYQKNLNCLPILVSDQVDSRYAHPASMLYDIQTLRDFAGWVMPYENICFVSERPEYVHFDENQRLHCETGPAIRFSDGFEICAWHGTEFPKAWIKIKPSASDALYWNNTEQRRVACEIVGWDMILNQLDAVTIDKNNDPEIGELVCVNIPGIGEEKFLRVHCGTGRQFALPVPPKMKTALQANAWTWGLSPQQYKPEVRT